ncbi:MAG TPA: hypothetical protein VK904_05810 [Miltoncostaeaceae bacterium]|nr:hypothetical protein [Miltoncostaeaceae bacterium]
MALRLPEAQAELVGALEPDLRMAAEAIGFGLRDQLTRLAPGLTRPPEGAEADAVLVDLDLDHDGAPDALSLAAVMAAHRSYVAARGQPEGVSAGALALGRLLVWAQRAALLGPAPKLVWVGPATRRPEDEAGRLALSARSAVTMAGTTRRAEAVALIAAPAPASGD